MSDKSASSPASTVVAAVLFAVAAVSVMVLLGLVSAFGGALGLAQPLVPSSELFRGFSSNAVISILAVMIIGAGLPMSRLLMPMGTCAILGGAIIMVGLSPLILLNDLIFTSNKALPAEHQMQTWSLFAVTPIGLALLGSGTAAWIAQQTLSMLGARRPGCCSLPSRC